MRPRTVLAPQGCPNCRRKRSVRDVAGQLVCVKCGFVVGSVMKHGLPPKEEGLPPARKTPLPTIWKFRRLERLGRRGEYGGRGRREREASLRQACSLAGLKARDTESAVRMLNQAMDLKLTKGRRVEVVDAALVCLARRDISVKQVSSIMGEDPFKVSSAMRELGAALGRHVGPLRLEDAVEKYAYNITPSLRGQELGRFNRLLGAALATARRRKWPSGRGVHCAAVAVVLKAAADASGRNALSLLRELPRDCIEGLSESTILQRLSELRAMEGGA